MLYEFETTFRRNHGWYQRNFKSRLMSFNIPITIFKMVKVPMEFKIKIKLQKVVIFKVPRIFIQLYFAVTFERVLNLFCIFFLIQNIEYPKFYELIYFSLSFCFAPLQIQTHKFRLCLNCSLCKNRLQTLWYYQVLYCNACLFYRRMWQNQLFYQQIFSHKQINNPISCVFKFKIFVPYNM